MSGDNDAPKPSDEELALQREQTRLLRQQRDREDMIFPFVAEQMGFDAETGELTEFGEQQRELQEVLTERQLSAARGELPVPSVVDRDLEDQEQRLHAQLREQFGAGYETASPAIERLEEFRERANLTREQARRGELTTAGDLLAQREQGTSRNMRDLMGGAEGPGRLSQLFQAPLSNLHSQRMEQFNYQQQVDSSNRQAGATAGSAVGYGIGSTFGGVGGPVGGAIGGAAGGYLGDIF